MRLREINNGSLAIQPKNQAGLRAQGLFSALLSKSISFAVDVSVEKICTNIDARLRIFFKNTLVNFSIIAGLNGLGMLCLLFSPFGERGSKTVTLFFLFSSFVYGLVRFVIFVKNYGRQTVGIVKKIWKTKSVSKGIECYVYSQYPSLREFYRRLDFASQFVVALKQIPKIHDIAQDIIRIYWKRIAMFGGILTFSYIVFYGMVRPLIWLKCW